MYGDPNIQITLVKMKTVREDDQDIQVVDYENTVFAIDDDISNGLFFRSNAEGYRLETTLLIHPFEYHGEQRVMYEGKLLKIEKVSKIQKYNDDWLALIVGELDGR